jgi:hypothetical protein
MYVYKMDIDSSKPSVVVDLSQKAGSQIVRWLPSSLTTDGKFLFWLGQNLEGKPFIYRSDINGDNFSMLFEFPYESTTFKPQIKHLTTDGKFIYTHIDGNLRNQSGGFGKPTELLLKIEISNPVLLAIDAQSILRNWTGEGVLSINNYEDTLLTDGKFLYFTIGLLNPNYGDGIVRSDFDGQNPSMIAEPKYGTGVTSMTNNKNSLFWVLRYSKFFQINQSAFDGSSKSVLIEVPVEDSLSHHRSYNIPSSIAFVSNNYLSSQLIMGVVIFLISLAIILGLLWIFSKNLSNSDIKQEAESEA